MLFFLHWKCKVIWHNSTCEMLMYMIAPHTFIYTVHNYNVFLSLLAVVIYIDPDYNQSQ